MMNRISNIWIKLGVPTVADGISVEEIYDGENK
jgi:hypothetical protein